MMVHPGIRNPQGLPPLEPNRPPWPTDEELEAAGVEDETGEDESEE